MVSALTKTLSAVPTYNKLDQNNSMNIAQEDNGADVVRVAVVFSPLNTPTNLLE